MSNATTEKNEFHHPRTSKKVSSSQSPLLDLPISVTECILERLPLPDYVRFGTVCKNWYLIQKQHRICHSSLPPPMRKTFPWLIPWSIPRSPKGRKLESLSCYSPVEQKTFSLMIPESRYNIIFSASASSYGWFFLVDIGSHKRIYFYNPVSKSQIKLPTLTNCLSNDVKGVLSASPSNPNCIALILDNIHSEAFLYRLSLKQPKWTLLNIPYELDVDSCVYCNGKFYCIGEDFFVIDSVYTTPTILELVMDCSLLPYEGYDQDLTLTECNGEVLLITSIYTQISMLVESLDVFKADFSRMMWVKHKSIGDHALFVAAEGSFSVLADDVGCKSNCVYFMQYVNTSYMGWSVFDMDIMKWLDDSPPYEHGKLFDYVDQWFLPSLDYYV